MKTFLNSIITPDGTTLTSTSRYDYVEHLDSNGKIYAIDGGLVNPTVKTVHTDYIDNSVTDKSLFKDIREFFVWGSYGKNGDEPLKKIKLKDLDLNHIKAIIKTQTQIDEFIKELFVKELFLRNTLLKETKETNPST